MGFSDRELFELTRVALGTDGALAAVVFYSLPSIAGHLSLVDRLLKHRLSATDFEKEWKPLTKSIKHHLDTRSIYAHHPLKRTGTNKNERAFYFYSIHIEPAELPLGRTYKGLGDKRELVANDLRKHAYSLDTLVKKTSDFRTEFPKLGFSRPAS
jgi:hypothetical protein